MRWKAGFIARQIAGEYVLVPVGETARQVRGMLGLSESGYLLYQCLQEDCTRQTLVDALMARYDVELDTALRDVDEFLTRMGSLGLLEE